MTWLILLGVVALVGLILYWLLFWTEGVYLGRRAVIWMYDITAHRYDGIKEFDGDYERHTVARPLTAALRGLNRPLLLDVATGTGRVPFLLVNEPPFDGLIVGLDAAARMLAQAQLKRIQLASPQRDRIMLLQQTAEPLPFADESFDAVSCLEALEFLPSDKTALREMARVLRAGGFLMVSRRIGWEGKLFFGRYWSQADFEAFLAELGFTGVKSHPWQANYDMITAWKGA